MQHLSGVNYSPLAAGLLVLLSGTSWAADAPPTEAISACSGLTENSSCTVQTPQGDGLSGSCQLIDTRLACVPSDGAAPSPSTTNNEPVPAVTTTSESTSSGTENSLPSFDASSSQLFLPDTDAGSLGNYAVTLTLSNLDPLTFEVDLNALTPVGSSQTATATYVVSSGALSIPLLQAGNDWWTAQLQQNADTDALRFEVTQLAAAQAPSETDSGDTASGGDTPDAGDSSGAGDLTYPIVDTNQTILFDATNGTFTALSSGSAFFGQDANYVGNAQNYTDNGDGTVTDNVTGLMWQKTPDFNGDGVIGSDDKKLWTTAVSDAASFTLADYNDWRLPTIQELYSLMDFSGTTGTGSQENTDTPDDAIPYLNTDYFDFAYGDTAADERYIDAQYWSVTEYVSTTMGGSATAFGVNFADGRIKGYPYSGRGPGAMTGRYVRYVRGNSQYGNNAFTDNGDGTISDAATGLMWLQEDSSGLSASSNGSLTWEAALAWCEGLAFANYSDWRLPNIKELHSIVDYSRSPDTTNSPAINPLFKVTSLPAGINGEGVANYPYYWSGTTHVEGGSGDHASYIAFGEARGYLNGELDDVHGAGAQRSDPKSGDASVYTGVGFGPQNDVIGIDNYARCVRAGVAVVNTDGTEPNFTVSTGTGGANEPPQEAIDACSGLSANASCSINVSGGVVSGACAITGSNTLACVPNN